MHNCLFFKASSNLCNQPTMDSTSQTTYFKQLHFIFLSVNSYFNVWNEIRKENSKINLGNSIASTLIFPQTLTTSNILLKSDVN